MNILCPNQDSNNQQNWPKCSFFGVYDGHGGDKCSDYLRDNLHQMIIRDKMFPSDPKQALINGCR
jgi:protein phosphatase 2C family protein 2/3